MPRERYGEIDLVGSPSVYPFAVTPHDTNTLERTCKGIYVGGTGDVVLKTVEQGTAVTFAAVPAGSVIPVRADVILATGTTATDIVGLA